VISVNSQADAYLHLHFNFLSKAQKQRGPLNIFHLQNIPVGSGLATVRILLDRQRRSPRISLGSRQMCLE
jgi:hypothetical protein